MFVGSLVAAYDSHKEDDLTPAQAQWFDVYRLILDHRPPIVPKQPGSDEYPAVLSCCKPPGKDVFAMKFRRWLYRLVMAPQFERIMSYIILTNVIAMAFYYHDGSDTYKSVVQAINDIGSLILFMEMMIKMGAFGFRQYFNIGWCQLEFVAAMCAMIDFLSVSLGAFSTDAPYLNNKLFRVVRVLRLLQLLRYTRGLNDMLQTLRYVTTDIVILFIVC